MDTYSGFDVGVPSKIANKPFYSVSERSLISVFLAKTLLRKIFIK